MNARRSETTSELMSMTTDPVEEGELKTRQHVDRPARFVGAVRAYWHEFCTSTSLHGLQYLGDLRRPVVERLWWAIALLVSVTVCAFFIAKTYRKWEESPVIVTFADRPTPIWEIPFPAVTVCSEIKIKRSVFNYMHAKFNISERNSSLALRENYEYALVLCKFMSEGVGNETLDYDEVVRHIEEFAPTVDDVLTDCTLKGQYAECSKIFSPILTDEGLCFTFNALQASEMLRDNVVKPQRFTRHQQPDASWTLEGGYTAPKAGKKPYPHRSQAPGVVAGLSFGYWAREAETDLWCNWPTRGLKVLLHSPLDLPQVGNQFFRAPLNRDVVVGVRPSLMNTSRGLWGYTPAVRQCTLTGERQLRYFRVYTQKNCQVECLVNITIRHCNCTPYYMPHSDTDATCGAGSYLCVGSILAYLMDSESDLRECACDTSCVELKYDVETSQTHFTFQQLLETNQDLYRLRLSKDKKIGFMSIFFKEVQFITSVRSELYGLTDFLANCGGLLGLFMGFSFLSLVEFVYFFTVRLCSNLRMRRQAKNKPRTNGTSLAP